MNQALCRCENPRHLTHAGARCQSGATEIDNYCRACHDAAAHEALGGPIQTTNIPVRVSDRFQLRDSLNYERITEYYKHNPTAGIASLAVLIAGSAIGTLWAGATGFFAALAIGILTVILLPPAWDKIREIERGRG